jgi:uncharacterized protein YdeI (YjbR/CyaY-like superfamily)
VNMPNELAEGLEVHALTGKFHDLTYSKRKEFARLVTEASAEETKRRRVDKIILFLKEV